MKTAIPLVVFFSLLVTVSVIVWTVFPAQMVLLAYSPMVYLLLCIGVAAHFLEENFTKAWEIEAKLRGYSEMTPESARSSRNFLVGFSHALILVSILFYFPIADGAPWAIIYGIGLALNSIVNGLAHTAILIKFRKNTGFVSGLYILIIGLLLFISIFYPI